MAKVKINTACNANTSLMTLSEQSQYSTHVLGRLKGVQMPSSKAKMSKSGHPHWQSCRCVANAVRINFLIKIILRNHERNYKQILKSIEGGPREQS